MISTSKCLLYSSVTQQLIIVIENLEYSVPPLIVLALSFFSFLRAGFGFGLSDLYVIAERCGHVEKLKTSGVLPHTWLPFHPFIRLTEVWSPVSVFIFLVAWHMTANAAYGDAWFTVEELVFRGFLNVLSGWRVLAHRALFMRRHRK